MDTGAKSKMWSELLGDKDLDETFAKVAYAAVLFERGSDEAKKYSVSTAPVIVLVEPGEGKVLKTVTTPNPRTIKTEVENAIKRMTKK